MPSACLLVRLIACLAIVCLAIACLAVVRIPACSVSNRRTVTTDRV